MNYAAITVRASGSHVFHRRTATLEEAQALVTHDIEQGLGVRGDVELVFSGRLVWSINDRGVAYTPNAEAQSMSYDIKPTWRLEYRDAVASNPWRDWGWPLMIHRNAQEILRHRETVSAHLGAPFVFRLVNTAEA